MYYFLFQLINLFYPANNYYETVNQAELSITNHDFVRALSLYDSAFAVQEYPLGQDLYNASLCAIELKDYKKAFSLSLLLANKKVNEEFFLKKSCYSKLRSLPEWPSFINEVKWKQKRLESWTFSNLWVI